MKKIAGGSLAAVSLVGLLWDRLVRRAIADRSTAVRVGDAMLELEMTGSGPPVLVLHGAGGGFDQGTWLAHVLGLNGYQVIAVSRPGYLGTPDRRTIDDAVALLSAALDQLGIGRVLVIGASGGGMTACAFAVQHPNRVRALVMLSAVSGAVATGSTVADAWQWMRASVDLNQALLSALRSPTARRQLPELVRTLSAPERRIRGVRRDLDNAQTFSPPVDVTVPTLIVHGTADAVVPFAHAERTLGGCSDGELVPIDGAGHLCCLTHAEVGERIRDFLARYAMDARDGPTD